MARYKRMPCRNKSTFSSVSRLYIWPNCRARFPVHVQDYPLNLRYLGVFLVASLLGACAVSRPPPHLDAAAAKVASTWLAPALPHGGNTASLLNWWQRFNDPVL